MNKIIIENLTNLPMSEILKTASEVVTMRDIIPENCGDMYPVVFKDYGCVIVKNQKSIKLYFEQI